VKRRDGKKLPTNLDIATVGREFWKWWTKLNGDWRLTDDAGRLVPGGTGSWETLEHPGRNGLALVVMTLRWWYDVCATENDKEEWMVGLKDVYWALGELLKVAAIGSSGEESEHEEESGSEQDTGGEEAHAGSTRGRPKGNQSGGRKRRKTTR